MDEITKKIEALRVAGFEPKSILMSKGFYNEVCASNPTYKKTENGATATLNVVTHWAGLPIKLVLEHDECYSVEVA